jgi:hypothetical protein
MSEVYEEFMVFELKNSGERIKLKINQDDLQKHLHSEQVLIIVREDLRRIFIWKGAKSPVRKRFISSRVAQNLQRELIDNSRFHRCKIVSIDQGDELQEFLNVFKLESMEVTERLPDMRYVRNIEREKIESIKSEDTSYTHRLGDNEGYFSPALADLSNQVVRSSISSPNMPKESKTDSSFGLSEEEKEKIKKKILEISVPNEFDRQNLILGHELYGAVSKISEVFGKNVEEITWEKVNKLPKGVIELEEHKFRVYLDQKKGIVEAVEVLKKKNGLTKEESNSKVQKRRVLPKIPSNEKE